MEASCGRKMRRQRDAALLLCAAFGVLGCLPAGAQADTVCQRTQFDGAAKTAQCRHFSDLAGSTCPIMSFRLLGDVSCDPTTVKPIRRWNAILGTIVEHSDGDPLLKDEFCANFGETTVYGTGVLDIAASRQLSGGSSSSCQAIFANEWDSLFSDGRRYLGTQWLNRPFFMLEQAGRSASSVTHFAAAGGTQSPLVYALSKQWEPVAVDMDNFHLQAVYADSVTQNPRHAEGLVLYINMLSRYLTVAGSVVSAAQEGADWCALEVKPTFLNWSPDAALARRLCGGDAELEMHVDMGLFPSVLPKRRSAARMKLASAPPRSLHRFESLRGFAGAALSEQREWAAQLGRETTLLLPDTVLRDYYQQGKTASTASDRKDYVFDPLSVLADGGSYESSHSASSGTAIAARQESAAVARPMTAMHPACQRRDQPYFPKKTPLDRVRECAEGSFNGGDKSRPEFPQQLSLTDAVAQLARNEVYPNFNRFVVRDSLDLLQRAASRLLPAAGFLFQMQISEQGVLQPSASSPAKEDPSSCGVGGEFTPSSAGNVDGKRLALETYKETVFQSYDRFTGTMMKSAPRVYKLLRKFTLGPAVDYGMELHDQRDKSKLIAHARASTVVAVGTMLQYVVGVSSSVFTGNPALGVGAGVATGVAYDQFKWNGGSLSDRVGDATEKAVRAVTGEEDMGPVNAELALRRTLGEEHSSARLQRVLRTVDSPLLPLRLEPATFARSSSDSKNPRNSLPPSTTCLLCNADFAQDVEELHKLAQEAAGALSAARVDESGFLVLDQTAFRNTMDDVLPFRENIGALPLKDVGKSKNRLASEQEIRAFNKRQKEEAQARYDEMKRREKKSAGFFGAVFGSVLGAAFGWFVKAAAGGITGGLSYTIPF
uniref:Uncharacterized protein n=1 Tax=Pyrodinium bahamense TaxID=73915 RepID=A0A7S0AW31_9DINO|mmetsp:Transcript_42086/g.117178  ORF Transcript_42086/g.117178 Transcript_42086/m.117178 type:complete len:885 (+) Transcript_42086:96-2750(+)